MRIFAGLAIWKMPTPDEMEIRAEVRSGTVAGGTVVSPKAAVEHVAKDTFNSRSALLRAAQTYTAGLSLPAVEPPGHTDLMVSPETIDKVCADPQTGVNLDMLNRIAALEATVARQGKALQAVERAFWVINEDSIQVDINDAIRRIGNILKGT